MIKTIIVCSTVVLCVLIASITSCSMQQNYIVEVGIKNGVDPVRASCAFSSTNTTLVLCATTQKQDK